MEVSHCTTNLEENGTEVRHQEEATSNQPVPEGTEIPLQRINSTHYNQDNTSLKHESMIILVKKRVSVEEWHGCHSKNPTLKYSFYQQFLLAQ